MSGNRIKYLDHKYKENHKISTRQFTSQSTGAKYRIILNLTDMQYYIRNERSKEFSYKSKTYTNLNVLKRVARARLEKFGVSLKREVRERCFGICEKGFSQEKWEQEKRSEKDDNEF